jgi:hypothetical protein
VNAILLGATGMVGQGVLRECLLDPEAESVLIIGRSATGQQHGKLHENIHNDVSDLPVIKGRLSGSDACFFCLGVLAAGMNEEAYGHLTYDLTISVAWTLAKLNPGITLNYLSFSVLPFTRAHIVSAPYHFVFARIPWSG